MNEIIKKILLIAGPCAAESREQVMAAAQAVAELGVKVFRAGVWKPRSHPGYFEGVGEKALEWLKEVEKIKVGKGNDSGESSTLSVAIEVAKAEHVKLALNAGLHILWLGARTTSNPFAVQEIADAIETNAHQKNSLKVLIKNPLTPDVELWSGAVERILQAGVKDIVLVHRGFTSYERSIYRNAPLWNIALQMRNRYPSLPQLCDPSHIGGKSEFVPQIAQQALDLAFDGLMVEVHPNPKSALSDASQQLSPLEFKQMLDGLKIRKEKRTNRGGKTEKELLENIGLLREEIDQIDNKLLSLLAQRIEVAKKIGECKKEENLPLFQEDRYKSMLEQRGEIGQEKGLNKDFVKRLMEIIHSESLENQIDK